MAGELQLSKGLKTTTNVPADSWRGPYTTVANACTAIPTVMRLYRTVDIITENGLVEYWWKNGTGDNDLVEKQVAGNSLGNWSLGESGWFVNAIDESPGISTTNWSIDGNGFFSGNCSYASASDTAGNADEANYSNYASYATQLQRNEESNPFLFSYDSTDIQVVKNIKGDDSQFIINYSDGSYTLQNDTKLTYDKLLFSQTIGDVAYSNEGVTFKSVGNGSVQAYLKKDELRFNDIANIYTPNWQIDKYGSAKFKGLELYDVANALYGTISLLDENLDFKGCLNLQLAHFEADKFLIGDYEFGDWGITKPVDHTTGRLICYMPNANNKTLAVSVNDNFADSTGNITLPITTANYSPTVQNLTNIYNTTPNVPVVLSASYTTVNDIVTVAIKINLIHITNSAVTKFEIAMPTGYVTNSAVAIFNGGIANTAVVGVCMGVVGNQFIEVKFTSLPMGASTQYNLICTYTKQAAA